MTDVPAIPPMHYADWFRRHAATRGNVVAITAPRGRLTYAGFHRAIHACAFRLADSKIEAGQTVAICTFNLTLHFVLIAALNRMGCVPLSVARPAQAAAEIPLPAGLRIDHVLVEQPFEGAKPRGAVEVHLDWLKVGAQNTKEWQRQGLRDSDALAHIFTLPGTDGTLKAVGLSTRQIEARIVKRSIGVLGAARTGPSITQFAARSSAGFQAAFSSFWAGGTIYIGFPENGVPTLMARERIERIEASPVQYRAILRSPTQADLSSLRVAIVAGNSAPQSPLIASIRNRLCRMVLGQYGTTETGMISFGPLQARDAPGARGHLVPWIQAEAVDGEGGILPAGTEGRLRFRCEEMAARYLNDPAATAEFFRDGWFYPGELGVVSAERALALSGRKSERAPQQLAQVEEFQNNDTGETPRGETAKIVPDSGKLAEKSTKKSAKATTGRRKPAKR